MADIVLINREALLTELKKVVDLETFELFISLLDRITVRVNASGPTPEDFYKLRQIVRELS